MLKNIIILIFLSLFFFTGYCSGDSKDLIDSKIESSIKKFVFSKKPEWAKEQISVNFIKTQALMDICDGRENIEITIPEDYKLSKIMTHMIIPFVVSSNKVDLGKEYLQVDIGIFKNIVVAKKKIMKGSIVSAEDIGLENKNVSSLQQNYYASMKDVLTKVAKGNISEGAILYSWMLKLKPVIAKGEKVTILVPVETLLVEAFGIALEDGQTGDIIKVKRDNSKETFNAVVLNNGVVKVSL
ncbi:flagella basal body P-ring formation protein FlgA [candidate division WOR-1 bacterium RIFOXYD2_FULL_36_8]|uniref:Flagella basal body P-ring formation protein FlgA n=1 Tax=candidate division WOR-1 bacterium RIFOXYB2_FULL_36_35 TaxID=1802578 RepID=A0A1F4S797_UNCSA|nr:MAG: flagella basal body P-ring formation protein FlgA [candidate division WOR-1 bacterium RIFOXYA2_FULL_36_21]OGC15677.1 MAG: flagella basal body P-ring formation protein FlgA [candidate division WOR-1 bacterium RIFOXYA12_FULL_36_13]OGC16325.1 MAG: flagella basal body P-ring formation protein FlgA [candidate division WOR-1 bacterium RIFOXYB2_FULL_36_35]OGC39084.1 MAG: flagella basal body P-ring formation protein FlgA [candidate division WOR-1 bacterium RIFOXYD2_FULL_36_8]